MLYIAGKTKRMPSSILYEVPVCIAPCLSYDSPVVDSAAAFPKGRKSGISYAGLKHLQDNLWPLDSMSSSHLCCDSKKKY